MNKPQPRISVILPIYRGREWINSALLSLVHQSLSWDDYEVIAIFNGPDDGSLEATTVFSRKYPDLRLSIHSSTPASAATARNVGIKVAKGDFIAFLDADDWISKYYLELLLQHATAGIIPVAQIVNVNTNGHYEYRNPYNSRFLSQTDPIVDPKKFYVPLSFMASKLFPREWVENTLFNEDLESSEDVEFNYRIYAHQNFRFSFFPAAAGATYYRRYTPVSVSRGDDSKDFLVDQRLKVMKALVDARSTAPQKKRALFSKPLNAQMNFIGRYFQRATAKEKQQIRNALVSFGVRNLNWSSVQDEPRRLVVALNFAPYSDTGAIVAGKRIREAGETVDLISNNLSHVREKHLSNSLISAPYIRRHRILQPSLKAFGSPREIRMFIENGLKTYAEWNADGTSYDNLYSRSMWPHSHFLAAAIKRTNPRLHWIAEFSDPNSLTVEAEPRLHPAVTDDISEYFSHWGTSEQQRLLQSSRYVMRWAELLPYFFADELVFTNQHQLNLMLENAPAEFKQEIKHKSIVSAHPTLPKEFYSISTPLRYPDSNRINLAYFGDFYKTRGMSEIFSALNGLCDRQLGSFRLDIFTATNPAAVYQHIPARVQKIVELQPKIQFLQFLSTLRVYDVLIVNDANTKGFFPENPYLPSKISDYRGADTPIWAITERGSILSSMVFSYESVLGDQASATKALQKIYRDLKKPEYAQQECHVESQ